MIENIPRNTISAIFSQALHEGLIREEDTAVLFHDFNYLASRIAYLKSCFPSDTLHGLAIKSNPLLRILEFTRTMGTCVEAATVGEVTLAMRTGYSPNQVIFDSPVKTEADLRFALELGVHMNCDNLTELNRVDSLLKNITSNSTIGIRINPQIGVGAILESSVAGKYSKFGVPVNTMRRELEDAFANYPWLTGVHLHVGSQGCAMEMLVNGVGVLYDFVCEVNQKRTAKGEQPVAIFDIGGGLPISYSYQQRPPRMEDYVAALRERAPGLFANSGHRAQGAGLRAQGTESSSPRHHGTTTPRDIGTIAPRDNITTVPRQNGETGEVSWRLITEFGRWVFVNSGFTVSRVEYVKRDPGINTAMIHVGADLFVRECLNPTDWKHEYSILDSQGKLKKGLDDQPYNIAGPLCFAGDILAKGIPLPKVEEGDWLVIHDTGGYTFSMWSRYNSRQTPRILGWFEGTFSVLKERESLEDLVGFWE